jgi:hypothetical protein
VDRVCSWKSFHGGKCISPSRCVRFRGLGRRGFPQGWTPHTCKGCGTPRRWWTRASFRRRWNASRPCPPPPLRPCPDNHRLDTRGALPRRQEFEAEKVKLAAERDARAVPSAAPTAPAGGRVTASSAAHLLAGSGTAAHLLKGGGTAAQLLAGGGTSRAGAAQHPEAAPAPASPSPAPAPVLEPHRMHSGRVCWCVLVLSVRVEEFTSEILHPSGLPTGNCSTCRSLGPSSVCCRADSVAECNESLRCISFAPEGDGVVVFSPQPKSRLPLAPLLTVHAANPPALAQGLLPPLLAPETRPPREQRFLVGRLPQYLRSSSVR